MPVLVLTARDSWSDKVAGLDAGADDYLAKPFQTEELIARLRALIRRASGNASSELIAGDIRLDTRSGKVTKAGEPVKLTAQEYKLLSYLMHHKGKVVSRTELIEHIYDQDFDRDSNTIEVFVTRIRKKLGADVITTIRGLGYSLEDSPALERTAAPSAAAVTAAAAAPGRRGIGSLTRRMIVVAALWIAVLLLIGGFALDRVLTRSIVDNFDDQLEYVLNAMIAASEIGPDGEVRFNRPPADQRFLEPYSGVYFQISGAGAGHLPVPLAVGSPAARRRPATTTSSRTIYDSDEFRRTSRCASPSATRSCPAPTSAGASRSPSRARRSTSRSANCARPCSGASPRSAPACSCWPRCRPSTACGRCAGCGAKSRRSARARRPASARTSRPRSGR